MLKYCSSLLLAALMAASARTAIPSFFNQFHMEIFQGPVRSFLARYDGVAHQRLQ